MLTLSEIARLSNSDTRTNQLFFIARPPPPKLRQRLRLRPRLLLQVQTASGKRHAYPVLDIWNPGIFGPRVAEPVCADRRSRANDLHIIRCGSQICDRIGTSEEEGLIALIQQNPAHRMDGNVSIIYFVGGWTGRASKVSEGHYACVWEHSDGEVLKMESYPSGGGTIGDNRVIQLSDNHVQNVELACLDGKSIFVDFAKGSPQAQGSRLSNLLDFGLTFILWILIQDAR